MNSNENFVTFLYLSSTKLSIVVFMIFTAIKLSDDTNNSISLFQELSNLKKDSINTLIIDNIIKDYIIE